MSTEIQDPGIGTQFSGKTQRVINRDGSFNIVKKGASTGFRDVYRYMIEISWTRFFTLLFLGYIVMNLIFTLFYFWCGYEGIVGIAADEEHPFIQTFFFSVQTFTTVGYGTLSPSGFLIQSLAAIEAFVGFLSFSLATGLAYGRFSKPNSKLVFSDFVLFAKHKTGYGIMIKLANARQTVLLDVSAKIILTTDYTTSTGEVQKSYYNLSLQLNHVELLPYTWTLVHEITEESPFWGKTKAEIIELNPEFLILIKGFDETFSQHVHTKQSFVVHDMLWGKKFKRIFGPNTDGIIEFDIKNINQLVDEEI